MMGVLNQSIWTIVASTLFLLTTCQACLWGIATDEPPLLISNCSPTSSDNFPSIFEAIEAGDACAVQQFIIDLDVINLDLRKNNDDDEDTPLLLAVRHGHASVVEVLLEHGASVDEGQSHEGWANAFPLGLAVFMKSIPMAKLLLQHGANVDNQRMSRQHSPLMIAAFRGDLDMMNLLLERGATIDLQDTENNTALWSAVRARQVEAIHLLAKKGANVDYPEEHGYTPLAHTDSIPVATALLDLGASVEGSSLRPSMPMTFAIMRDDLEMVNLLLSRGASVNPNPEDGMTPLLIASCFSKYWTANTDIISALLEHGSDVNASVPKPGLKRGHFIGSEELPGLTTPLMCLAARDNTSNARLLLMHGAQETLENVEGKTARDLAAENGFDGYFFG